MYTHIHCIRSTYLKKKEDEFHLLGMTYIFRDNQKNMEVKSCTLLMPNEKLKRKCLCVYACVSVNKTSSN